MEIVNRYDDIRLRVGCVYIDPVFFTEIETHYEMMNALFSKFIPKDTNMGMDTFRIRYIGYSMDFEKTEIGMYVPIYNITWDMVDKEISFQKADELYNIFKSDELIPDRLFTLT